MTKSTILTVIAASLTMGSAALALETQGRPDTAAMKIAVAKAFSENGTTPSQTVADFISNKGRSVNAMRSLAREEGDIYEPEILITPNVKAETVIFEDFSKWAAGSEENPDPVDIAEDEEFIKNTLDYDGGQWTLFQVYQAGGCAYLGFDEIGEDGPGYIKTPDIDLLTDGEGYYRFTVKAKNVNANATDQGLQSFFLDEENNLPIAASTLPLTYNEWTECQWIGSTSTPKTSVMTFGWMGKVLIDDLRLEKLTFPLKSPVVKDATMVDYDLIHARWEKVEGATSYLVQVRCGHMPVTSATVGDVDEADVPFAPEPGATTTVYVTAINGDDCSYYGYWNGDVTPDEVGTPVALAASDITAEGFTANWERAANAAGYMVLPTVTHTAAVDGEEYTLLDDTFSNIPETADDFNPIQVMPAMGMGGTDLCMSRAGWDLDLGLFFHIEGMPVLVLTDMYASMGILGRLSSPAMDFSAGKVRFSGTAFTAADDITMIAGLMDAEGNIYESQEFDLTTMPGEFEVEFTQGQADSRFFVNIAECSADEDMVAFLSMKLTMEMQAGSTVTTPAETCFASYEATSCEVKAPVDENNSYVYAVQGYYSANLIGAKSNEIKVDNTMVGISKAEAEGIRVSSATGEIVIANPLGQAVDVYAADGRVVAHGLRNTEIRLQADRGIYLVKASGKTIKVMI